MFLSISATLLIILMINPYLIISLIARAKNTTIDKFPYQVAYYQICEHEDSENSDEIYRMSKFCSGSILNEKWVITAAHCIDSHHEGAFTEFICSGSSFINCKNGTLHKIDKKTMHPEYKEAFNKTVNDIGLLRVVNPFVYSERVHGIALASYQPGFFRRATITGWGITETGYMSAQLKETTHIIEPSFMCKFFLGSKFIQYQNYSIICSLSRSYICSGDSGGPLVIDNTLVGIVTMGLSNEFCKTLYFGQSFYTAISQYRDWINDIISDKGDDNIIEDMLLQ